MKILVISTWFPFPPNNGSRARTCHLLRNLARNHSIDLLAVSQTEKDFDYLDAARRVFRRAALFKARGFRPESRYSLSNLFSLVPRGLEAQFNPDLNAAAHSWTSGERYDAVLAVTLGAAPYAVDLDIPYKILDQHNVESQVLKRQWKNERTLRRRLRYAPTWIKAQHYERAIAREFDLITVVSETEGELMRRLMGPDRRRIAVVENGVDPELLEYSTAKKSSDAIVFSGAVTYQSNYDAVEWLCTEIFPEIRRHSPQMKARITGGCGDVDVSQLAATPGIEFTGYVDDIRPIVAGASALIVPIRYGGGTRLKILEAMALGTPVISTRLGAEGLDVEDGVNILLGENAGELSDRLSSLLQDEPLARRISNAARRMVGERYRWPDIADRFERAVLENQHPMEAVDDPTGAKSC